MRYLTKIAADSKGVASIELATVAPVMFLVLLGVFEMSNYARAQQKVAVAAQTLADVVAEQLSITGAASGAGSIGDLCNAASAALAPLPSSGLTSAVFERTYDGVNTTTPWGYTCPNTSNTSVSDAVPAGMMTAAGDTVIEVQVTYSYSSKVFFFLPTTLAINQTAYARPRINKPI